MVQCILILTFQACLPLLQLFVVAAVAAAVLYSVHELIILLDDRHVKLVLVQLVEPFIGLPCIHVVNIEGCLDLIKSLGFIGSHVLSVLEDRLAAGPGAREVSDHCKLTLLDKGARWEAQSRLLGKYLELAALNWEQSGSPLTLRELGHVSRSCCPDEGSGTEHL